MKLSPGRAVTHYLSAALFLVFAWFQRNDIDPVIYHKPSSLDATAWFVFYLLIAVLFVVAVYRSLPSWILIAAVLACLAEMAVTGPGLFENLFGQEDFSMTQVSMSAEDPRVELSREFFGAVIALAGVGYLIFTERQKKERQAKSG
ncbi:MAG: transmembrane 220 family protein [Verrucomicrobiota bacterium]